jgi:hypothetical protein
MGVLDDAIREHLDLKRRHGAAEEELRRQEAEALGPARREVAPAETEDGDGLGEQAAAEVEADAARAGEPELAEATAEEQPAAEHEDEAPLEPEAAPPAAAAVEDELVFDDEDDSVRASDTPTQGFEAVGYEDQEGVVRSHGDELLEDEPFVEDEGSYAEPASADDDRADEEDEAGEDSAEDADVLEDTPDFLQETPEHDRLWFEQKPPRDFDFD